MPRLKISDRDESEAPKEQRQCVDEIHKRARALIDTAWLDAVSFDCALTKTSRFHTARTSFSERTAPTFSPGCNLWNRESHPPYRLRSQYKSFCPRGLRSSRISIRHSWNNTAPHRSFTYSPSTVVAARPASI
jgi:hypothetical protein